MTSIELLVVLGIMSTLATMVASGVIPALRRSRANQGVGDLAISCEQAQRFARLHLPSEGSSDRYGVVVDPDANEVRVVLGDPASPMAAEVLAKRPLNRNLVVYQGTAPLASPLSWFYQYRTGYPVDPATGLARAIGACGPGDAQHLSVRTLDQDLRIGISVYEIGVVASQEF
jgi:type II secretory pathway pseudopilin PulG